MNFSLSTNNDAINILIANVSCGFIIIFLEYIHRSGMNGTRDISIFKTIDAHANQFSYVKIMCGCELAVL